jgi:hypothetical protein
VTLDGVTFDSQKEARRWEALVSEQKQGLIQNLQRQVRIPAVVNGIKVFTFVADYTYMKGGKRVVVDCKSAFTRKLPVYRLKKRVLAALLQLEIVEV